MRGAQANQVSYGFGQTARPREVLAIRSASPRQTIVEPVREGQINISLTVVVAMGPGMVQLISRMRFYAPPALTAGENDGWGGALPAWDCRCCAVIVFT